MFARKFGIKELIELLSCFNISVDRFGKGKAKRLEDLLNELKNGDCELMISKNGIYRKTSVIRAQAVYGNLTLQETHQVFDGGRRRSRGNFHISQKIHIDEDVQDALKRAFAQELGIKSTLDLLAENNPKTEVVDSPSYSPLPTKFFFYDFTATLTKEQGYVEFEEDTGITTYFKWIDNPN